MEENKQTYPNAPEEDVIDIAEIIAIMWYKRKTILIIAGIFIVLGLIEALANRPEYKAEARIFPELTAERGLAGGVFSEYEVRHPNLYPNIISSTTFFHTMLYREIEVPGIDTTITVRLYMEEFMNVKTTRENIFGTLQMFTTRLPFTLLGLPGKIMGWLRGGDNDADDLLASRRQGDDTPMLSDRVRQPAERITQAGERPARPTERIRRISNAEHELIRRLRNRINSSMDNRTEIMSISAEFPDPFVAAQIAQHTLDYLHDYVVMSQVEKSLADLAFLEKRFEEREQELYDAQMALARFQDANRYVLSAAVRTEEQRLEHNYNLSFTLFNEVATKLEQTRIRVQESTPVLQILEDVQVPVETSGSGRKRILMIFTALGVAAGVGFVFVKRMAVKFISKVKEYKSVV